MSRFLRWLYSDVDDETLTFIEGYWTGAFVGIAVTLMMGLIVAVSRFGWHL